MLLSSAITTEDDKTENRCCEGTLRLSTRIMVIDDDRATRELFEFVLAYEDWDVSSYAYNQADLGVVQQLSPNLIILDVNMVYAGEGWAFLQLLSMEETTAEIPVVICTTALNLPLEIEGYLATRRISIVRKPFDIDAFILTIRTALTPEPVLSNGLRTILMRRV